MVSRESVSGWWLIIGPCLPNSLNGLVMQESLATWGSIVQANIFAIESGGGSSAWWRIRLALRMLLHVELPLPYSSSGPV